MLEDDILMIICISKLIVYVHSVHSKSDFPTLIDLLLCSTCIITVLSFYF
jgi:hypothetical protein